MYSRLEYRYNNRYTSPVETLRGGEGTCGKYMELLVGSVCTPDYDHAWVEFYVPAVGWVPMESSSDNTQT